FCFCIDEILSQQSTSKESDLSSRLLRRVGGVRFEGFFRIRNLLRRVQGEQPVVAERMTAMNPVTVKINEQLRAGGQPQLLIVLRELHRRVFDNVVLRFQSNRG